LLEKFPTFTEPKTVMKSRTQNAQETSDEGVGDEYWMCKRWSTEA